MKLFISLNNHLAVAHTAHIMIKQNAKQTKNKCKAYNHSQQQWIA